MTTKTEKIRGLRRIFATAAVPVAVLLGLAGPVAAAQSDKAGGPPGNNGTVKIDRAPFDSHPNNEPHVGCKFEVDFYGFDEGDLDAQVIFTAQPPTGKGEELLNDPKIFIGEDDNSGGGSQAGLDAHREYDLTSKLVGRFPEHPQQGYHVKLTVHAEGSQGADTKHKVVWVQGCVSNPPTDKPKPPIDKPSPPIDKPNPPTDKPSDPDKPFRPMGDPDPDKPGKNPTIEVQGKTENRPTTPLSTGGSLPQTGAGSLALAGLGTLLLAAGQGARVASRLTRGA
jgi:hypothetical protein